MTLKQPQNKKIKFPVCADCLFQGTAIDLHRVIQNQKKIEPGRNSV